MNELDMEKKHKLPPDKDWLTPLQETNTVTRIYALNKLLVVIKINPFKPGGFLFQLLTHSVDYTEIKFRGQFGSYGALFKYCSEMGLKFIGV